MEPRTRQARMAAAGSGPGVTGGGRAGGRARRAVGVAVAVAAMGGWACAGGEDRSGAGDTEQALVLDAADVAVARRGVVAERLALVGDLQPYRVVTLTAQVPGTVRQVAADRGTRVALGQRLARIEAEGIRGQAAGAEAAVAAAEAGVALARQQLESAEMLYEAGALAELDLRGARTAHEAARAQLAGARAQATGADEAARRATVTSPMAGIVAARMVEAGEPVNPGQPLFTVVDLRFMELRAQLPVGSAARARPGAPVVFNLDAYPGETFTGTLDRVEPTADPDTRQVAVYARLPNPDQRLVGGLFARGWVVLGERADAVTVPQDALRDGAAGPHVLVIRDGRVHTAPVTPGLADPGLRMVEIREGIEPGDTVLVVPGATAPEGAPVRVGGGQAPLAGVEGG